MPAENDQSNEPPNSIKDQKPKKSHQPQEAVKKPKGGLEDLIASTRQRASSSITEDQGNILDSYEERKKATGSAAKDLHKASGTPVTEGESSADWAEKRRAKREEQDFNFKRESKRK